MSSAHTSSTLYRTYRPSSFAEIKGQKHIVDILERSIGSGTLPHALLFAGSRGLGKTSIARIVAHEIGTSDMDIIEIDAASTRGIDDIRALKEEVNVLPRESSKKVYIIDEVHMLTREAFNALLKTLEEPPRHIMFILATTELHKVPDTIVSRCQVHHFSRPETNILAEHLVEIAKKEGKTLDLESAVFLAEKGNGSYRDALGALQKALDSEQNNTLTIDEIRKLFQTPSIDSGVELLESIAQKEVSKGLLILSNIASSSDIVAFFGIVISLTRDILFLRSDPTQKDSLVSKYPKHLSERIQSLASSHKEAIHSHFLLFLLEHGKLVRTSPQPLIVLETLFLASVEKGSAI